MTRRKTPARPARQPSVIRFARPLNAPGLKNRTHLSKMLANGSVRAEVGDRWVVLHVEATGHEIHVPREAIAHVTYGPADPEDGPADPGGDEAKGGQEEPPPG